MAKTIRFDASTTLTHQDPTGVVPTSATAKFVTADGADAQLTGSVVLPTVATSLGSPNAVTPSDPYNWGDGTTLDPTGNQGLAFAFDTDELALTIDASQTPQDGDQFTAAFDSTNHTTTYHDGQSLDDLMTALAATMSASPTYNTSGQNPLSLTGKVPGQVDTTVTVSTSSSLATITAEHVQVGVDAVAPIAAIADQWACQFGGSGGPVDGGTVSIDIGARPYSATFHDPDDGTQLFADLVADCDTDPDYAASVDMGGGGSGPSVLLVARVAGARSTTVTASTTFPGVTMSATNTTPGADAVPAVDAVTDIWSITAAVPDHDPADVTTDGFFDGMWLKAAAQYRRILTHTAVKTGHIWAVTLALDTTVDSPYGAWQTGTPANTTPIAIYGSAVVAPSGPSGSTRQVLVVLDATGIVVGDLYRLVAAGVQTIVQVTRVNGLAVTISPTLDAVPPDGSPFKALKMAVVVSSPGQSKLGTGHRLVWAYTDGTTERQHVEALTVARWVPDPPITAEQVKSLLASYQPSSANTRDGTYYQGIADRVAKKVEEKLLATGRRQSCYGDPNAFDEAGRTCARLYLADDGFYPAGATPDAYLRECQMRLEQELRSAAAGLQFDADGDGAITGNERQPRFFSFQVKL